MTPRAPPSEPLVVVLGTTGVGKSDLAVELACRFNGEVINADAMQMYKGLPIITNKISAEEQRGVPHHLLGNIGLDEPTWNVHAFTRQASKVIREIRSRGKLPIIVGGTQYYTDGLLFDDHLVDIEHAEQPQGQSEMPGGEGARGSDPILQEPTEKILARLREVDPMMANRWHPNDRRKIQRSLAIYLIKGRPASEIYAEQQRRKDAKRQAAGSSQHAWQTLLFWVYADPDVLEERLNSRVDKMLQRGLVEETQDMYDYLQSATANGVTVDRTTGIWQSIGFSEMEPYLEGLHEGGKTDDAGLAAVKSKCVEAIKASTRRYAKTQVRWIKYKTLPLMQGEGGALSQLFLMDSTDLDRWGGEVAEKAVAITRLYLEGGEDPLPEPLAVSERAKEVLASAVEASNKRRGGRGTPCRQVCHICGTTHLTEEEWQRHLSGNRHRRAIKHAKRTALVAVPDVAGGGDPSTAEASGASPEDSLGSLPPATGDDDQHVPPAGEGTPEEPCLIQEKAITS